MIITKIIIITARITSTAHLLAAIAPPISSTVAATALAAAAITYINNKMHKNRILTMGV
jgi:hypothetical protein